MNVYDMLKHEVVVISQGAAREIEAKLSTGRTYDAFIDTTLVQGQAATETQVRMTSLGGPTNGCRYLGACLLSDPRLPDPLGLRLHL